MQLQWKRTIRWILLVLGLLIAVVLVGGYFFLKSNTFDQIAIRRIKTQAHQSTGADLKIGSFRLTPSALTVHLYNVVVQGKEPASAPPLLAIKEVVVGLKFWPLVHGNINLTELLIRQPFAYVLVNRNGINNLPTPPASTSTSHTNIFDLAIEHFVLSNGTVAYNDRELPLQADLHDLHSTVAFHSPAEYEGTISYDDGQLRYATYAPLPHSLNAKFTATPSRFDLQSALVKIASSSISLNAEVTNFSDPSATGAYEVHLHTQDFANLMPSIRTAGEMTTAGNFQYQNRQNQPLLRSIVLNGSISSDRISAASSSGNFEANRFTGGYKLSDGTLQANSLKIETLNGVVDADLTIRDLGANPIGLVRASMHHISLAAAQHSVRSRQATEVAVTGILDGTAEASWIGSMNDLRAKSDLQISAAAKEKGNSSAEVPVNAIVHAAYDGPKATVTLRQTTFRIPSMKLTANGEISRRASLRIHADATDIHSLVELAAAFRKARGPAPAISGSAILDANINGSIKRPHIAGQMQARNIHVQASDWKTVAFSFQADASQVVVSNGSLINANRGRASFDARAALQNWSYSAEDPIHANVTVQQMPISDLQHLANVSYPVSGNLSAKIAVNGSERNPAGSGHADLSQAEIYGQPVRNVSLKFQASNGSIASTLNLTTLAGSLNGTITYAPKAQSYKVALEAPSIALQKLQALQEKDLGLEGNLSAFVHGEGTISNPQLNATVEIPKLELRGKSVDDVKAEVAVANQRANLTFNTVAAQAFLRARAQVALTGEYQTTASIDSSPIPLGAILATFSTSVPEGLQGQTEIHASMNGPLKRPSAMQAQISVPILTASYDKLRIQEAAPIRADYRNQVFTLQPAELRGTDTSLRVQGAYPIGGATKPTLTASGTVDMRIMRIFDPTLQSSGQVALDVHASGSAKSTSMEGQIRLENVNAITPTTPLGVERLNAVLDISNDRVQITSMKGQVGGGDVSVGGSIVYRPELQFALAINAKSVRLRYPTGIRTELDSTLAFSGNRQASTLSGRVLIDNLFFTPAFDLTTFAQQFGANTAALSPQGFASSVKLAISLQSKEALSATSSQVSIEGSVNLNVLGTAANPVLTGRADLTSGEFFYHGNRYQLQRGVISFANPNETNPDLNVAVATTIEQYNLTINLRGPLDRLTTSYMSDPPLATADIIHLIAFGNTSAQSTANSASESTDAMVASTVLGTGLTSGIQKLAGFSALQIDPLLGGSNQNPSARIAFQERVTKNLLFTFSTDVSQPGQELVQGDYQINKRWSVTVTRDEVGGISVDGRYHTRF